VLLVHEASDAPDGAALAGRVPTLEQHDHPQVLGLEVPLQLQQLHLPWPQCALGFDLVRQGQALTPQLGKLRDRLSVDGSHL